MVVVEKLSSSPDEIKRLPAIVYRIIYSCQSSGFINGKIIIINTGYVLVFVTIIGYGTASCCKCSAAIIKILINV